MVKCELSGGKSLGSLADKYDLFSAPVPHFNLEGTDQTGSPIGLIFSIGLYGLMFVFSYINV
jgi:hypothetical protein